VIRVDGRAVVYGELWFEEEPPADAGVDILVYRCRRTPVPGARTETFRSLQTDLSGPPEALVAACHESCRYEVRRADARDGLRHEVMPEATDSLEEFCDFFDAFAKQVGLPSADRHWLTRVAAERQLVLSCATRDGAQLVWHAHLRSGYIVRLAYSASWFRGTNTDYRSLIGRANRWLHWRDMLYFREAGAQRYDWGGIFADESTPERAGINRFKKSFGGQPVVTYECTAPATIRGRVWLPLREAWRRRHPPQPLPALRKSC
jgi:hypothetical protein